MVTSTWLASAATALRHDAATITLRAYLLRRQRSLSFLVSCLSSLFASITLCQDSTNAAKDDILTPNLLPNTDTSLSLKVARSKLPAQCDTSLQSTAFRVRLIDRQSFCYRCFRQSTLPFYTRRITSCSPLGSAPRVPVSHADALQPYDTAFIAYQSRVSKNYVGIL